MKKTFLGKEKPLLTLLYSPASADEAIESAQRSLKDGAEAFCIQTEALRA